MLNKPPGEISVGEVVAVLEGGATLVRCDKNPDDCERVDSCLTRYIWREAAEAMFQRLSSITFADLMNLEKEDVCRGGLVDFLAGAGDSNPSDS